MRSFARLRGIFDFHVRSCRPGWLLSPLLEYVTVVFGALPLKRGALFNKLRIAEFLHNAMSSLKIYS
jgi:hypothetical protein